ncbi:NfeD family protein [Marivirga harenae]|uniref:NfeD family protein n=1 Tax=Marivirga harenae TaxID=2010992 RepID=UPI0026DEE808|nr:NfeD family protein [Marivirga harenae]WKV10883.1 NfeD family protein [Marivirga harenae]|tara:strand:- start:167718 stop:168179 length:462 start_codon:yes stop_codon:yes gene_type:complete
MIGIIFLILAGLLLIIAELIFVPGTTFVGVIGLLLTIVGIFMVFDDYGNVAGYWTVAGTALVTILGIVYSFKSNSWDRFSLKSSIKSKVNDEDIFSFQVGEKGKTVSDLKPIGKAEIFGKIYEVRSKGEWIGAGQEIQIIRIDSKRIFVEPIK